MPPIGPRLKSEQSRLDGSAIPYGESCGLPHGCLMAERKRLRSALVALGTTGPLDTYEQAKQELTAVRAALREVKTQVNVTELKTARRRRTLVTAKLPAMRLHDLRTLLLAHTPCLQRPNQQSPARSGTKLQSDGQSCCGAPRDQPFESIFAHA